MDREYVIPLQADGDGFDVRDGTNNFCSYGLNRSLSSLLSNNIIIIKQEIEYILIFVHLD